jgi:hypothetical protein
MSRTALEIDPKKLEDCIRSLEKSKKFNGLSDFWEKVAQAYGDVSATTVKNRATLFKIQINVKKTKKTGVNDMSAVRNAKSVRKVYDKKKPSANSVHLMKERVIDHGKQSLLPLVDKIEEGNIRACIKLHCLECMGYDRESVRECTSPACQFHWIRPYQSESKDDIVEDIEDD